MTLEEQVRILLARVEQLEAQQLVLEERLIQVEEQLTTTRLPSRRFVTSGNV